jgi:hypothetical protein
LISVSFLCHALPCQLLAIIGMHSSDQELYWSSNRWANGSQPNVGGRDEKDLPAGCYFYELPVVGFEIFFGMQGSYSQTDGQRRAICKRRAPLPAAFCCTPNTGLTLGHGSILPFGDDMVLQHGRPAAIFGLAKAGATVVVEFDGKTYSTTANPDPFAAGWNTPLASNSWRVELDSQPPGPAKGNITVSCADCDTNASTAVLSRVLFGEVIICSGQSNMELPLQNTFSWWTDFEHTDIWSKANSKPYISNDTDYPIRTLQLGHNVQLRENLTFASPMPSWTIPSYDALKSFSATCWYTARAMYNLQPAANKTPFGLIEASWGGTIIEAWIPIEDQYVCTNRYCEDYVDGNGLAVGKCNRSHTTVPNEQPGSLWNGEIAPLANMTINGVIWYLLWSMLVKMPRDQ